MSRRGSRASRASRNSPAPRPPALGAASPCPCGLSAPYGECCGRLHSGAAKAGSPEALMRSRYSAFVVGDEGYLLRTWHPDTRPPGIGLEDGMRWVGLEILGTTEGSAFHQTGTVTFRARYTDNGQPGSLYEVSRFVRLDGDWVYVDGDTGEP
ncbi:YchJ family protein [Streptomyces apocyni]|uniref:YchJ family protein n=1 Tax=Streptomyces apocyni TaxID=2654677 RepID=UPI0012EA0838|nr:YchJ family protein [Streptomyces apocyni]